MGRVHRDPLNVRFAPKATKLLRAAKCRDGPNTGLMHCNKTKWHGRAKLSLTGHLKVQR